MRNVGPVHNGEAVQKGIAKPCRSLGFPNCLSSAADTAGPGLDGFEDLKDLFEPSRTGDGIIIQISDKASPSAAPAGIAGMREPKSRFIKILNGTSAGELFDHLFSS